MIYLKNTLKLLKALPKLFFPLFSGVCLIIYSKEASSGIKEGLSLLGSTLIPSLFPFLVFSSYITDSNAVRHFAKALEKPTHFLFKTSGVSALAIIFAFAGGYPLGAKTAAELCKSKQISKNEARRLMLWCVCPSPAFTVTALGSTILKNTAGGIIMYVSALLSALTLGALLRFCDTNEPTPESSLKLGGASLSNAVSSAEKSIILISGWVLTFSCIAGVVDALPLEEGVALFIKTVLEVTSGIKASAGAVPLPVTAAAVCFGGVSVICQILPYLKECDVPLKPFIAARIISALLCAFYASGLLKLFPNAEAASVTFETNFADITLSYTAPISAILMIMCALFVFQVDNRKKIC